MFQESQDVGQDDRGGTRGNGGGEGLLGKLFAGRVHRDRQVQVVRRGQTQQSLQINLPWCRGHQIGAAHNMRNALRAIIDRAGEVIGKALVGAKDHTIALGKCEKRKAPVTI